MSTVYAHRASALGALGRRPSLSADNTLQARTDIFVMSHLRPMTWEFLFAQCVRIIIEVCDV